MKKILLGFVLASLSAIAMANPYHHQGHRHGGHHHHRGNWAPWVGGAVVGAVLYDIYNRPVIVQQPPVVVQQPPIEIVTNGCTAWREIQQMDGTIIRERTCYSR